MKTAYIFIGIQGSGKGTQAKILAEKIKTPIIESGELFRNVSQKNNPDSLEIEKCISKGKLVPDAILFKFIEAEIKQSKDDIIIDGLPRTITQKKMLDPLLIKYGYDRVKVIYIHLSDDEAMKRMKLRGRSDDSESVINKRLGIYHQQTKPIIELYKAENRLIKIDGFPGIEMVAESIAKNIFSNE